MKNDVKVHIVQAFILATLVCWAFAGIMVSIERWERVEYYKASREALEAQKEALETSKQLNKRTEQLYEDTSVFYKEAMNYIQGAD